MNGNQPQGCIESLASVAMSVVLLAFAVTVLVLIALLFMGALAVFLVLRFVTRRYVLPQFYPATAVFAEQRLFGAPPDSQLFTAYDYWLGCLERATGLSFTHTPGQLLVGSLILSLAPTLVLGAPLALLIPELGNCVLPGLLVVAVVFGSFMGYRLGQPAQGWFEAPGGEATTHDDASQGGFTLGEEDW